MPNQPSLSAKGSFAQKKALVAPREIDAVSLPVSFTSEAPKKFPKPTPKVVSARPVTF